MNAIYLDHNATTALDPAVRDEMMPWLGGRVGNPSSIHAFGQEARRALDKARARVARLIGAQPEEIVFTSGGTEANNLAILGVVATSTRPRLRIVTSAVEHQAVLKPCFHLEKAGGSVTFLPVDAEGLLSAAEASSSLREDTLLASVMLAINLDLLGLAVSTGAACSSADNEASHVLRAMGRSPAQARSSVRFSFGRENSHADVLRAVALVMEAVGGIRESRR